MEGIFVRQHPLKFYVWGIMSEFFTGGVIDITHLYYQNILLPQIHKINQHSVFVRF